MALLDLTFFLPLLVRVDSPSTHSIDGYNGSLERQEGVKVPDKKAKLTPAFQTKSKEGSVVDETVNVLPMKVKLEKITKENADLQTELKQKITKLLS